MSSGEVLLNEPRNDLANGVRELATTTASRMDAPAETVEASASRAWALENGGSCFVKVRIMGSMRRNSLALLDKPAAPKLITDHERNVAAASALFA